MGRILALDFGEKRTGIAVSDELKIIASGLTTVKTSDLLEFLNNYVSTESVDLFVIGLPKRLNNEPSQSEMQIKLFIDQLVIAFPDIGIKRVDERFTSKMAFQTMIDSGLGKKKRRNKALVDEISATIILQSYLYSK